MSTEPGREGKKKQRERKREGEEKGGSERERVREKGKRPKFHQFWQQSQMNTTELPWPAGDKNSNPKPGKIPSRATGGDRDAANPIQRGGSKDSRWWRPSHNCTPPWHNLLSILGPSKRQKCEKTPSGIQFFMENFIKNIILSLHLFQGSCSWPCSISP